MDYDLSEEIRYILDDRTPPNLLKEIFTFGGEPKFFLVVNLIVYRELQDLLSSHQNSLPSMLQGGNVVIVQEQNLEPNRGPVGLETLILNGNEEMPRPQLLQDQMSSFHESLQIVDLHRGNEPQPRRNRRGRRPETNQHPSWLPEGWHVMTKTRQNGSSAGHVDKYYVRPDGKKFRSKKEVEYYLQRTTTRASNEMEYTTLSG